MVGQLRYHDDRRTEEDRYGLHGFEGKGRQGHGYGGACCGKGSWVGKRRRLRFRLMTAGVLFLYFCSVSPRFRGRGFGFGNRREGLRAVNSSCDRITAG